MARIDLPSRSITFSDSGGSGTPIVLAHGFALDSTMFGGQLRLAPEYRIIAWDAPGHGATPGASSATPFTFWDLARDQFSLMDHLGIETAVIGGVSQGGFIALRAALLAPERVSALLLMDTEAEALGAADAEAYRQLFAALSQYGPTGDLTTALAAQIVGDFPAAQVWAQIWRDRGVPLGEPVDCLTQRDDVSGRLAEIDTPALVLCGEHDLSIPRDHQDRMRTALRHATALQIVPGAGHSAALTHPDEVNALISTFLRGALTTSDG